MRGHAPPPLAARKRKNILKGMVRREGRSSLWSSHSRLTGLGICSDWERERQCHLTCIPDHGGFQRRQLRFRAGQKVSSCSRHGFQFYHPGIEISRWRVGGNRHGDPSLIERHGSDAGLRSRVAACQFINRYSK